MKQLIELCDLVEGTNLNPTEITITGAASISRAVEGDITFVTKPRYLEAFERSQASAAVVPPGIESCKPVIVVEDPERAFARIVALFRPPLSRRRIGISPSAHLSESAIVSDDVDIYPGAYIGEDVEIGFGTQIHPNVTVMDGCIIGSGVVIYPSAVLYPGTVVGDHSIIHAGVVLGANGFGYRTVGGRHLPSPQLGNVVVENDVEIGANTTVDRGTYDSTLIGEGSKLDDHVMIGHNCKIGKHNILCSQVGIAGSCTTGDYVVMGGQVGIGDHLEIGDGARLAAKTGVMQNIEPNASVAGIPSVTSKQFMQHAALMAKLPQMRRQLRDLLRRIPDESGRELNRSERAQDAA